MFTSRSLADSLAEKGFRSGQAPRRAFRPTHFRSIRSKFCLAFISFFAVGLICRSYFTTLSPSSSRRKDPLTVLISSADARATGELDYWIHRILARLGGRPIDIRVQYPPNLELVEDSLVAALVNLEQWTSLKRSSSLKNVGLLRIGDEQGNDSAHSEFTYVMRPYHFERYFLSTASPHLWIPNGYSKGVGPRLPNSLLPFEQRDRLCYFEGSYRDNGTPASRENMKAALERWDPQGNKCEVRWTAGFMEGRSPLEYSAQLGRTKYALSPAGHSGETIRFYEALENNAIPIVVDSPWMTGAFGNATKPFVVLNSWDEVGSRLDTLRHEKPEIGRARQLATRLWWESLQDDVAEDARRIVDRAFQRSSKKD